MRAPSIVVAGSVLPMLLLGACDREPEPAASVQTQPTPRPETAAKGGEKPEMPPEARRNSPPEGLQASALEVGQPAPPMEHLPSTQGTFSRGSAPAIVVFYRGFW